MNLKDLIPLFLFFCILIPSVHAVTVNAGTVFNTTFLNSSITFSFNVNVSNFTIESDHVLIYDINFTNSSGTYICENINFSSTNSNLDSSDFNCTLQSPTEQLSNSDSGGGASYYFYEKNKYFENNILELKARIKKDDLKELDIYNRKGTDINKIIIKSRNYLSGEIKISKIKNLPQNCNSNKFLDDKLICNILQINSSIDEDDFESVSLRIDIDNLWLERNNITEIGGIKCLPFYENLKSSLIQKEKHFSSYNFTSNGFSTWVIFGIRDSGDINEDYNLSEGKISKNDIEEQENEEKSMLLVLLISSIIIAILISDYYNKRKKAKNKKSRYASS